MSSSTRLFSFRQTRISNERDILLRRTCVSIPQTEKMRSTNACDAVLPEGRELVQQLTRNVAVSMGLPGPQTSLLPVQRCHNGLAWENWQGKIRYYVMISVFVIILVLVSVSFFTSFLFLYSFSFHNHFSISFSFSITEINHSSFSFTY